MHGTFVAIHLISETSVSYLMRYLMQPIQQKIHNLGQNLSASEARLAHIIIENISQLSSYSATELSKLAGTSKATTGRFFKRLGYASFNELRTEARHYIDIASPLYLLLNNKLFDSEANYFEKHIATELQNIVDLIETFSHDHLTLAKQLLEVSPHIYVIGFRNNSHLAQYMSYLLNQIRSNVVLIQNNNGAQLADELASLSENDLIILMDHRRRIKLIELIAAHASKVKAKILRFTDLVSHDFDPPADITLRTSTRSNGMFDSYSAVNSLINALCTQFALSQRDQSQLRLNQIEQLHQHYQDLNQQKGYL